jgi:photosystem II stability/assembly factor-like uncharacterized protein
MKLKCHIYLIVLAIAISACGSNSPASESIPSPQVSPTSYPDTPTPAEINAPLIESPALVKLDMLDELNGWGVTETQIARTSDGGVTWHNVTPPDIEETGSTVDTFVLDGNHAWVQKPDFDKYPNSGVLYRTTDGGVTWTNASVPFSRGDIKFLDASNGWVLADLGVGAGSNAVAVYQSTNGGNSWEQMYINDPNDANAADSLPLGGIKSDLVPLNMKTAWVTGVTYAPGTVYLYRTDDSGHSWTQVPMILPAGAENFEVDIDTDQMKFVSASDGYLALRMAGDSTQTAVYVTQDAGKTWVAPSTPLDGAGASVFLSADEAIIYNGTQFYVTQDAAHTWVTVSPNIAFADSFADMEFINAKSGWVLTFDSTNDHRSLYRTTDGGATWSPVIP